MSILVSNIRLPFDEPEGAAIERAKRICNVQSETVTASVYRTSIDARRGKIDRVYSVLLDGIVEEEAFAAALQMPSVCYKQVEGFTPIFGQKSLTHRPVVVGMGPAGLFAAYILAKYGYCPLVLERGDAIEQRDQAVHAFWEQGRFDCESNIQFGEGGAGAYSDGKLTTRINDPLCDEILRIFTVHGAPEEIRRLAKPHIGTDILKDVVRRMREQIIEWGGEVHFRAPVTGIQTQQGTLCAVEVDGQPVSCERAIFALGHSARDTFFTLHDQGVFFEPKPFSVGARIEHLQTEIDRSRYGRYAGHKALPPAEYNLSHRENGRACYSFCMCPGGHVVAAQSEADTIVTNGMSYHARSGCNANAAIAVSVEPTDYADGTPFGGIAFQRALEQAAYQKTGSYEAPCQLVGDFLDGTDSKRFGKVLPTYPMGTQFCDLNQLFPRFVSKQMQTGLAVFARQLRAFGARDAVLTAPETRTSSPVRMTRGQDLFSRSVAGLIPCGEGAGYAGGIMSAAVDGMRAACRIMEEFKRLE
ncbi:MAG: hypothetical protein KHY89_00360 [Butyricicoccus pullicaecorum]|nr:hypothetical protein [Butyricicoccus pullicaecorum]